MKLKTAKRIYVTSLASLVAIVILATIGVAYTQSPKPTMTVQSVKIESPDPLPVVIAGARPMAQDDTPVRVTQTGPVTFQLPKAVWVAWLVSVAGGLTAVLLIWRFVVKVSRLISDIDNYGSVLREIAKEFKNDSGTTLKDVIDEMKDSIEKVEASVSKAEKIAALAEEETRQYRVWAKHGAAPD